MTDVDRPDHLEVQPMTLFYTIFERNGTPFVYLPGTNGTTFTYLVQKIASLLTAINTLSLVSINKSQNQTIFSNFSQP